MICVRIHSVSRWLHLRRVPLLPFLLKSINRIVFSVVLPPQSNISPKANIGYDGMGTVIHRDATIGDDVIVGPGVTLGGRSGLPGGPTVQRGVLIGSGAAILGPITIGEFASIGSNAVVLEDVPPYGVVVGVPAKLIRINTPDRAPKFQRR